MCYHQRGGKAALRRSSHGINASASELVQPLCVRLWRITSREFLTE